MRSDKRPYTVGQTSLYSRTNVLIQSDKSPYTVGQKSLYSRTNVLKSPYTKLYKYTESLYFTLNPVAINLFVVLVFSDPSSI